MRRRRPPESPAPGWTRGYAGVALAFAIGIPVTAWGMSLPSYAPQEYALGAVLHPDPYDTSPRNAAERRIAATFSTEREIAAYLDGLDLPPSSVITDTVYGFAVVAASGKPERSSFRRTRTSPNCSTIRPPTASSTC